MSQPARIRLSPSERRRTTPHPTGPKQSSAPTLIDAIHDENLFRPFFSDLTSWSAWLAFLKAAFGLPMTADELAVYQVCTNRQQPPDEVAKEVWLVIGRRGGKSRIMALLAVYIATFIDHAPSLALGETGVVQVLAADRRQARVILKYVKAFLAQTPMLAKLIAGETQEAIALTNRISIEVTTASFRSVRGRTVVAALLDEIAFWQNDDSANPDAEILAAIRPSMLTVPNAMLIAASSPYARRGVLYEAHKKHFGKDGPVLVWQSDTATMNPAVDRSVIDAAYDADPAAASAEYGGLFRKDLAAYITREIIEACVTPGVFERVRLANARYSAFCDPAGGSGKDSFTVAIAHKEGDVAVLDCIREFKPPFSPDAVVSEISTTLKSYGISRAIGDRYAGQWVAEVFKKYSITYDAAALPKSDLYRDCLPMLNSKRVELLDHAKMVAQFVGLERRTARSGKDSIDHGSSAAAHDDICNAVAGVITNLSVKKYAYDASLAWVLEGNVEDDWRAGRLSKHMMGGRL